MSKAVCSPNDLNKFAHRFLRTHTIFTETITLLWGEVLLIGFHFQRESEVVVTLFCINLFMGESICNFAWNFKSACFSLLCGTYVVQCQFSHSLSSKQLILRNDNLCGTDASRLHLFAKSKCLYAGSALFHTRLSAVLCVFSKLTQKTGVLNCFLNKRGVVKWFSLLH